MIYLASSWRNPRYFEVLAQIRAAGFECYDFRNPRPGDFGFSWTDVWKDVDHAEGQEWREAGAASFLHMLDHPIAGAGFGSDMSALRACDTAVLVLPCGRSAHLELGYAVGADKRTAILLDERPEPELMYRMVDFIALNVAEIIEWLAT